MQNLPHPTKSGCEEIVRIGFLAKGAVRWYCPFAKNSKCPTFCRRIL